MSAFSFIQQRWAKHPWRQAWPGLCAVCHQWQGQTVCAGCITRFAPPVRRCMRCATTLHSSDPQLTSCGQCLREPPPQSHCIAALDYGFPWARLITALKFRDGVEAAAPLAERLSAKVQATWREGALPRPDLVLPTPLSPQRLRERGHNQTWELARRVAPALGLHAEPSVLLKLRDTAEQSALAPAQRQANVRGAFAVAASQLPQVRQRHVAVVDDVMTTGHTAREMANVLLRAGAASVQIWVVARTPKA